MSITASFQTGPSVRAAHTALPAPRMTNLRFAGLLQVPDLADQLDLKNKPIRVVGELPGDLDTHLAAMNRVVSHAQKARKVGNLSGRHYGALVEFANGVQGLGTNVEASRQTTFCDLRYAVNEAFNRSLEEADEAALDPASLKVKTVYMANAEVDGLPAVPCSDCQEWLNSDFFDADTRMISLEKDADKDDYYLYARPLADMLPLHKGRPEKPRMTTEQPLGELDFDLSDKAAAVLSQPGNQVLDSDLKMRRLLSRAQKAYEENRSSEYTEKAAKKEKDVSRRTGVSVLVSPFNLMMRGGRFEWTTRWFEAADLKTGALAFQLAQTLQALLQRLPGFLQKALEPLTAGPKIKAVAYYGDDPDLPPIASLGRIGRRRGSEDTLIITVENDRIQIRTISDFLPEIYKT